MKLSFVFQLFPQFSSLCRSLSLSNLLLLLAPFKDRLERYLAWYAHRVKGEATPARPRTSSEISGIAEGSDLPAEPCSNTIFILILLARASDCRRE